jgi:Zn finger protein HypA/HybF involved in hydrogenase expression
MGIGEKMPEFAKTPMVITCRICNYERSTTFPQIQDKVVCPNCGLHGHTTISNSQTIETKSGLTMFIPAN